MLYRHSEVFRTLVAVADVSLVAFAWVGAHCLVVGAGPSWSGSTWTGLEPRLAALGAVLPLYYLLFRAHGIYEPQRTASLLREIRQLVKASAIGIATIASASFFLDDHAKSRASAAIFGLLAPSLVIGMRLGVRGFLRGIRRRGFNLRYVIVVGGSHLAEQVIERIQANPWAGLRIRGLVWDGARSRRPLRGIPFLGPEAALPSLLNRPGRRVDQVIIALPREESDRIEKLLAELEREIVNVSLVPDLAGPVGRLGVMTSLDGLPVLQLHATPLVGWGAVGKRAFDILCSSLGLVLASPLLIGIAVAIRVTSGRPVFFVQKRMGLDGRVFRMFKFRSMIEDAEALSGPVWAEAHDPRTTRLGAFLRRSNLDELPQLWNVLRGDMSLVGPRPERPYFIESFRSEIPRYMQRHKVKSGLTGWAQVNGWRGRTSIHERLDHDLHYIRNWSFELDCKILLMTLWQGLARAGEGPPRPGRETHGESAPR